MIMMEPGSTEFYNTQIDEMPLNVAYVTQIAIRFRLEGVG